MVIKYNPILSIEQQTGDDKPMSYMNNTSGPLSNLQAELHWHLHDLSRFHQVITDDLNKRNTVFGEQYNAFKVNIDKAKKDITDEEELEYLKVKATIQASGFNDIGLEIDRSKAFSDEFSVIGLWATAEKYLKQVYMAIEHHETSTPLNNINPPYQWDLLKAKFEEKSIFLADLDGHADANECRVLNNTIKHGGVVSPRLAQFVAFSDQEGKALKKLDLDVQRYYNGISSFLGNLIQKGNKIIDPSFLF
ncbi:hypothetical protein MHO82_11175 [Vibrio sp. Of7-15]|uniref:hypothetical protein n=1 Tax=Vibrio sp. Of7-15 TaxID=2724879 RepID=UPI001EF39632|nr:hypothetical protein [Vibrio sp. Of7-15]MCG7497428.1 hypothetical protein [Vibrio sp. Of7-15]